jgi:hypothetical protein
MKGLRRVTNIDEIIKLFENSELYYDNGTIVHDFREIQVEKVYKYVGKK